MLQIKLDLNHAVAKKLRWKNLAAARVAYIGILKQCMCNVIFYNYVYHATQGTR